MHSDILKDRAYITARSSGIMNIPNFWKDLSNHTDGSGKFPMDSGFRSATSIAAVMLHTLPHATHIPHQIISTRVSIFTVRSDDHMSSKVSYSSTIYIFTKDLG